jgi:DNA topoisomerase-1
MARLRHVTSDALGVERRRQGKGYVYLDSASGRRVGRKDFLARARHLAIPPAWQSVRIAADALAHIQACGTDAAGRLQYIYHPEWEVRRTRRKQKHLAALTEALPRLRRRVRKDLTAKAGDKALALAIAVALIDRTAMRVGRERYLTAHGTRGAGTLFSRDAMVRGDEVHIAFLAKGGMRAEYVIGDPALAEAIERIRTIRGKRLLMCRDDDGKPRVLRTEQINAYLKEITGAPVTAKDFRTLHASALAGEALAQIEPGDNPTKRKRQVADVIKSVAAFLQNTPAICRKSYVAPILIELFERGVLAARWAAGGGGNGGSGLRQREARLAALIGTGDG